MIRRNPTEIPLRQEDVTAFIEKLQAKKAAEQEETDSSRTQSTQPAQDAKPQTNVGINMVEVNREARAGMTRESRLGL
jgi:hypothetical protein